MSACVAEEKLSLTARIQRLETSVCKQIPNGGANQNGSEEKLTLKARLRGLEASFANFESKIAAKVLEQIDGHVQEKIDARMADLSAGTVNSGLVSLVQHVSLEQMDSRSQLNSVTSEIAELKARLSRETHENRSCEKSLLPGALANLDEICQHVTLKLQATSDAEAEMRGQIAELRSELDSTKETAVSPQPGLGSVLVQFDAVCRQLTQQVEASSEAEADLRQQIADLKSNAQSADQSIEELQSQLRNERAAVSSRKPSMRPKGQFDVDFPRADCAAMDMDLGQRVGAGHSPKSLRVKSVKGNLLTGHVALSSLDRAPSCPALPPLASVW